MYRQRTIWASETPAKLQLWFNGLAPKLHMYMTFMRPGPYATPAEKKSTEGKGSKDFSRAHLHDKLRQPLPCHHPGLSCSKAGTISSCTKAKIYCYENCACASTCLRRFKGCKCVGGCVRAVVRDPETEVTRCAHMEEDKKCLGCKLKKLEVVKSGCQCQAANRECTPGTCLCDVAECLKPSGSPGKSKCQNCGIQKGEMKDMVVATSSTSGYGVVLNEAVQYGEYVGDHVREIINRDEYNRRKALLSKWKDRNYFFTLNKDVMIDSAHYGNVTRFINNSYEHRNCHAAIKLVTGEHRIGFWSTANLSPGWSFSFIMKNSARTTPKQAQRHGKGGLRRRGSDESEIEESESEESQSEKLESGCDSDEMLDEDEETSSKSEAKEDDDYVEYTIVESTRTLRRQVKTCSS